MAPVKLKAKPVLTWHFSGDTKNSLGNPVIGLVHNFGGSEDHFYKHIQLINSMGFDVASFDLSWHKNGEWVIFTKRIRPTWSQEIKLAFFEILKTRDLVSFTFSGIGACTLDAIAELLEEHPVKIKGLVFDSGPFTENLECVKNMLEFYYGFKRPLLRSLLARLLNFFWDPRNSENSQKSLNKIYDLDPDLPILSLQGLQDKIVPIRYIQDCFKITKATSSKYLEVVFETGGHLTNLKMEPSKYQTCLEKFFLVEINKKQN